MPQYYFDIETVPLDEYRHDAGASFDPCKAKIISIQYQRLDSAGGEQLVILKEWSRYLSIVYGTRVDSDELFLKHTYLATLEKLMLYSYYQKNTFEKIWDDNNLENNGHKPSKGNSYYYAKRTREYYARKRRNYSYRQSSTQQQFPPAAPWLGKELEFCCQSSLLESHPSVKKKSFSKPTYLTKLGFSKRRYIATAMDSATH